MIPEGLKNKKPPSVILKVNNKKYLIKFNMIKVNMKKLVEACVNVNAYIDFLGDSYTLASYEIHPWNYCGYRSMARQ